MIKAVCALLAGLALAVRPAIADTITLKSGVQVHGMIVQLDGQTVVIDVGGRLIRYPSDAVASKETNDNHGTTDIEAIKKRAAEHEAEMIALTGLTAAERRRVNELLKVTLSDDPQAAGAARDALIALGATRPVFTYLAHYVHGVTPRFVPPLLEALVSLNPDDARAVLREQACSVEETVRARSLKLLARIRDDEGDSLMCRGLIDHADVVRVAAAEALGALGAKDATPLLLANLTAPDQRVQNSALTALRQIWAGQPQTATLESQEDWHEFWSGVSDTVPNAVQASRVMPLVEPGTQFVDE